MTHPVFGIILAAGKGTRFKAKGHNKTAALFQNKPLVHYGAALLESVADKIFVVVGAHAESVKDALRSFPNITFVAQKKRLGTGHATVVALKAIEASGHMPEYVLLGYGDHMMFYTPQIVKNMLEISRTKGAAVTLITALFDDPTGLGRIKRNNEGKITGIIEQKDATEEEKQIQEINAGFYCFRYDFLKKFYKKMKKSPITGEYYLTDLIHLAVEHNETVEALIVPYHNVGIGINSQEELETSMALYSTINK